MTGSRALHLILLGAALSVLNMQIHNSQSTATERVADKYVVLSLVN